MRRDMVLGTETLTVTRLPVSPLVADRRLARSWWLLALLALGISTLCAVLLVVARTPFLGFGAGMFRTALVLHVDFAVVVWFLAVAAGVWLYAVPVSCCVMARLARLGVWLAGSGMLAMLLGAFDSAALPVLANYVPVLDSVAFYLGIALFLAGIGLTGMASLASLTSHGLVSAEGEAFGDWRWAVATAILAFWAAIVVFMLALSPGDEGVSLDGRLWGGGHVLQIVHTLMLMSTWLYLGRRALLVSGLRRGVLLLLLVSELLAVLGDLLIVVLHPVDSLAYRQGFTEVMRWATWPAPIVLGVYLLIGHVRLAQTRRLSADQLCLLASVGLFALGCLVGAAIRGETTVVPAHYHGTVGAVTLAYMLWARRGLRRLGGASRDSLWWKAQPWIYAAGITLMVLGLTWAGQFGAPRKAPHVETVIADGMHHLSMGVAGTGGLLATLGAAVFVLGWLRGLWMKRRS